MVENVAQLHVPSQLSPRNCGANPVLRYPSTVPKFISKSTIHVSNYNSAQPPHMQ